ncbi:MAG TPA: SH3 domain-containing protein [Devosia sp.]|jgi:hypothetical protein|uniref:SH3 domain-containing protein n=1 Tax=Devosia sp. TaxID=1871048 RepID=UPI002F942E7E
MRLFTRLLSALPAAFLALSLSLSPASALSESGTLAWSTDPLTLREGPGTAYDVTGTIAADLHIKVLRCQQLWCLVDGDTGRGWTDKNNISFGKTSADWPGGINPDYPSGGTACFYTGSNYSGLEYCFSSGRVIRDLHLAGLDNRFNSVRLYGTSVAACRDRFFQSYCERIIESQPVLDQYLQGALSSVRVY